MSTRRIGSLALGVAGALSAGALLILRRGSTEELVQVGVVEGVRTRADFEPMPQSDLERPETSNPDGRMPASTSLPEDTGGSGEAVLGESVAAAPTYPVELRMLPEFSLDEMTRKRDAIQEHLTRLTEPIFEQRFRDGKFERLSLGMQRTYLDPEKQRSELSSLRRDTELKQTGRYSWSSSSTLDRTALPRSEYRELYVLKDEIDRLTASIQELALANYYERKAAQAFEAAR